MSFLRLARDGSYIVVVLNFTPVAHHGYRLGVPAGTDFQEILNSDSTHYGGSNVGNSGVIRGSSIAWMGRPASIVVTLPPLAGIVLAPVR